MNVEQIGGAKMILRIEQDSDIPIYTQVTNQIIEGIASGELKYGQSLPSVRSFAADLGVNMHTVNKSYHELEKKGIIQIVPKSGAVILTPNEINKDMKERVKQEVKPHIAEAIVLGMNEHEVINLVKKLYEEIKKI